LDKDQLETFYTNLWKAQIFPRYLQEINSAGEEVHRSPYTKEVRKGKLVADSGFWDSYSTVYPLQSMVFADNMGSLIDGWVDAYQEAKWLPQWASPGDRNMMVSTMGDVSLADAIVKSKWGFLTGFNVSKAYEAIRKDAFETPTEYQKKGREGLVEYDSQGYVPAHISESVSRSLNYYLCDAAIANAAKALGKHDDEKLLSLRSKRYTELFDPHSQFFRPKDRHGNFLPWFNPESNDGFTEASAWQYRFYVPHDVKGLKELYGSVHNLCDQMQNMMSFYAIHPGVKPHIDARFPNTFGLYWHGNQPVHHVLWVAKKAGCNQLADKYLRETTSKLYTKDGWAGDEDNGEMSSWYILSALGLYSLEGAKDELVLGSPSIKHATVQLINNKVLTVDTKNQAKDHVYVQSVTWTPEGGSLRSIEGNTIKFTELMQGGTLSFELGDKPNIAVLE
jgi:predicted alpha-1,2-mannosidase